jgi:hypothetical protein
MVGTDSILFILRLISALVLLGILGALFVVIWRDYHASALQAQHSRRTYGALVGLVQADKQFLPTGTKYPLLPITSLGRAPTNTVLINDSFASSEHAIIALKNGQWWLEDRNSTNGTMLNGEAVTMPIIVTDGDIVGIGKFFFKLSLE